MSASAQDGQVALSRIKRMLSGAPAQMAGGVARVVRDAPDGRLERVMRTPVRRVVLDGIFWQMPRHLDRERAVGTTAAVRWCITGRADGQVDTYYLEIVEGTCRVTRGAPTVEPRLTITLDGAEFLRLVTGNADALRAYFAGRVALSGDMMLAGRLASLFRSPR